MKLYTKEQLEKYIFDTGFIEIYDLANDLIPHIELPSDSLCINCDESESTHNICMDCIIKIGKENIQLPSDEEINKEIEWLDNPLDRLNFKSGIKWMRDKIRIQGR